MLNFLLTVIVLCAGLAIGAGVDAGGVTSSSVYLYFVTALLAVGLYSSTRGIDLGHLRGDLRTVLLAVTVGVLAKAVLISAVMYAVLRRPEYLVLGVAVAQIDPLSVAALQGTSRMSERGRALLLAWASFDDPVTTLLTIYAAAITVLVSHPGGRAVGGAPVTSFVTGLTLNVAFAAVVLAVCAVAGRWARRGGGSRWRDGRVRLVMGCALLAVVALVAVTRFWMLGIALVGLFLRPAIPRLLDHATRAAFVLATFALGAIAVTGVRLGPGLLLGCTAFLAQAVVSRFITRGQGRPDREYLALAQQNGITAIILALLLERDFPGTVAVVAPAILVINLLHIGTNALHDRGRMTVPLRLLLGAPLPVRLPITVAARPVSLPVLPSEISFRLVTVPAGAPSPASPSPAPATTGICPLREPAAASLRLLRPDPRTALPAQAH